MSENAQLIEVAKLDLVPVKEFLEANGPEIDTLNKRLTDLRSELYKIYNRQVEGAMDTLQEIAYSYGDKRQEAESLFWEIEGEVNKLGLGIGSEGAYLWTPSTCSC